MTNTSVNNNLPRWDWLPHNVLGKTDEQLAEIYEPWLAPFVLLPSGETASWDVSYNKNSGWQSITWHGSLHKPSSAAIDSMVSLVRKNGEFGILLSMDYSSSKSEIHGGDYLPVKELTARLLRGLKGLQEQLPCVDFALLSDPTRPQNRMSALGFIRHGILHKDACAAINGLMFLA